MIIIMVWVTDFASIFISNTKNSHCHYISNQFSNFFFFFFAKCIVRNPYFHSDMVAILRINTTYNLKITVNFVNTPIHM